MRIKGKGTSKIVRMLTAMIASAFFLILIGVIGFERTVLSYGNVDAFCFVGYMLASLIFIAMGIVMAAHARSIYKLPEGKNPFDV